MRNECLHFSRARAALHAWEQDLAAMPRVSGLFETHIFCTPLDPSPVEKERFVAACTAVGIKALCLGLDYQEKGVVSVLQSTKYYEADSPQLPVARMLQDAEALSAHFDVVRLKLEAMADNPGIPQTVAAAQAMPGDTYFEYHLKVEAPVSAHNDERLKELARALTQQLGVKIPFSCNNLRDKTQRFLNVRTYGIGHAESAAVVQRVLDGISAQGFAAGKVIREFIVFDTNKDLDRGWLEF